MISKKPNIVFILIDDMGWMDLVCYGSEFYETPNIDKLSKEGMLFTNAYAASPLCSPARASILTGRYPATVGVTDYIDHGFTQPSRGKLIDAPNLGCLPLSEKSLADALGAGGYHTWHVGKWHLGEEETYPQKHGFDVNIAGTEWGYPLKGYFSPWGIKNLEEGPDGEYLTDRITDEAIRLINNNDGRPFFLNLWHFAVHVPLQAKEEDVIRFQKKAASTGLDKRQTLVEGEPFPAINKKHLRVTRRIIQSDPRYAAMIYNLDWNIGRLLKAIDDAGQTDNTLVIFTSDNGGDSTAEGSPTCNAPLSEGKGWMYEGGVRVPLIIKWPDVVKAGSVCDEVVTSPDFYPTLIDAAELPLVHDQVEGVSFLNQIKGGIKLDREAIYWHYPHYGVHGGSPASSMRMGDFKLIEFFEDYKVELYNLKDDISEEKNLSEDLPDLVAKMKSMLENWRKNVGAKLPKPNPDAEEEMSEAWHYIEYGALVKNQGTFLKIGDYKLIEYIEDGKVELYNIKEDANETRNLAEKMPKLISWMRSWEGRERYIRYGEGISYKP